jgi:hypothetical protein
MFSVNADDEPEVVVQPLVGLTLFIALKVWEEGLWSLTCHAGTVT